MILSTIAAGLGLGLSLIIAIGAQNLFVLRQGIRREHVLAVALTCAVSDVVLILAGVSGVGAVLQAVPWLIDAVRWAGAAFLVGYGLLAARRAWRPSGEALAVGDGAEAAVQGTETAGGTVATTTRTTPTTATRTATLGGTLLTCLALTWLNPHVYLDTVFLLGSVANTHGETGRWLFALGAGAASVIWFLALAYGARLLSRLLASPRAWRILDAVIAVVMIALGISLVLPH